MEPKKFKFKISTGTYKYYRIYESGNKFYAQYNYRDGLFSGENYSEIGKAYTFDEAMIICRSHATQFGGIEGMEFR